MANYYKSTEEVAEYLKTELVKVLVANGFETDLGERVFLGKRNVDEDEIPCVSIIEGEDQPGDTKNRDDVKIQVDFALAAYLKCDTDAPNTAAHAAIRDMKRVVWRAPNLGNRVGALEYRGRDIGARSDGEAFVMAVLHFSFSISENLKVE